MQLLITALCLLSCATGAGAQSFFDAISQYPQLSNFTLFYQDNFPIASQLLTNSSTEPRTVLIPNNNAFANFERDNGYPITELPGTELLSLIQYHVLVSSLTATNFSESRGLTVPSLLVGGQYNNRSAGMALSSSFGNDQGADGQVVFIRSGLQSSNKKFLVRRSGAQSFGVHSGLSSDVNLTALDGVWDGGRFHEVDQFVLFSPLLSDTLHLV